MVNTDLADRVDRLKATCETSEELAEMVIAAFETAQTEQCAEVRTPAFIEGMSIAKRSRTLGPCFDALLALASGAHMPTSIVTYFPRESFLLMQERAEALIKLAEELIEQTSRQKAAALRA